MKKREVWTFLIYVIRCMMVHPNERGCQFFVDLIFSIAGEGSDVWFVHSTHVNKVPRMCLALGTSRRKGRALLSWSWHCNGKTGPEQWHHGGCWRAGQLAQSEGSMWGPQSAWGNQVLEMKLEESLELYLIEWGLVLALKFQQEELHVTLSPDPTARMSFLLPSWPGAAYRR